MEDDVVLRSDGLDGFAFAAVFDGHAGFSSVEFLRFLISHTSNSRKNFFIVEFFVMKLSFIYLRRCVVIFVPSGCLMKCLSICCAVHQSSYLLME